MVWLLVDLFHTDCGGFGGGCLLRVVYILLCGFVFAAVYFIVFNSVGV